MITVREMYRRAICGPFNKGGPVSDYNITEYDDAVWVTFDGTAFPEGITKWYDMLTNLDCRPIKYYNMGWFANGFFQAMRNNYLVVPGNGKPVIYSGFSHGGAIADLYAQMNPGDTAITFGAPRTRWGIKTRTKKNITHYAIRNDPVVRLAPAWLGFYHPGKTIWLDRVDAPMIDKDLSKCSHMQYGKVLERMGI